MDGNGGIGAKTYTLDTPCKVAEILSTARVHL